MGGVLHRGGSTGWEGLQWRVREERETMQTDGDKRKNVVRRTLFFFHRGVEGRKCWRDGAGGDNEEGMGGRDGGRVER